MAAMFSCISLMCSTCESSSSKLQPQPQLSLATQQQVALRPIFLHILQKREGSDLASDRTRYSPLLDFSQVPPQEEVQEYPFPEILEERVQVARRQPTFETFDLLEKPRAADASVAVANEHTRIEAFEDDPCPNFIAPYMKQMNSAQVTTGGESEKAKFSVPVVKEQSHLTGAATLVPFIEKTKYVASGVQGDEDTDISFVSDVNFDGNGEPDYEDVVRAILCIAKDLPKNVMLDECLDSFSGRINTVCGNVILHGLWKERLFVPAFSFFEWMRVHDPCLLDSRSFCTIFTLLGEADMVDRALILFNYMKEGRELRSVQSLNALMSALSNHGRYGEVLLIFQEMSKMNIEPDSITFSTLIASARKSNCGVDDAWRIFCSMEERNIFAGHTVFGALIKAFCENGLKEEALMIMSEMEKRGLIPNVVIYNTLIDSYGKANMLEEAEGLTSEMENKGLRPSVATYNSLINTYGKQGKFEAAEALLQDMIDKGLKPDVRSYSALISAYGRLRLSEKAANVFLRMKKNGICGNTFSYSALIHAYVEDGWHKKAELAFENMLREGLIPTVETYTSLLHGYRQAGDLRKLNDVWKRMQREKCSGTRATFNVIMDAFARQGCYAEARGAINEFVRLGLQPDRKTYNILLNAYARGGQHSKVPQILAEMRAAGFAPDSFTYTTLIFTFLRVRDFNKAFEYHEEMCKHQQLPDQFTYSKLSAILDAKHEIKMERNMKASIGHQQKQYDFLKNRKKTKRSWKRRRSW